MSIAATRRPWLPYVAPMAAYMLVMLLETKTNLVWVYPAKVALVAALLWVFHNCYEELKPKWSAVPLAVAVGLVAIGFWIFLDPYYPQFKSTPFNPEGKWLFIAYRVAGAVLVVPLMEELFWRGFLIRWLVEEDFKTVPVGTFTLMSFTATTVLFGMEHNQWLAGLICGALYNWLYCRTRSVFACVVAHAVSNAALASWVLWSGDWKFW